MRFICGKNNACMQTSHFSLAQDEGLSNAMCEATLSTFVPASFARKFWTKDTRIDMFASGSFDGTATIALYENFSFRLIGFFRLGSDLAGARGGRRHFADYLFRRAPR